MPNIPYGVVTAEEDASGNSRGVAICLALPKLEKRMGDISPGQCNRKSQTALQIAKHKRDCKSQNANKVDCESKNKMGLPIDWTDSQKHSCRNVPLPPNCRDMAQYLHHIWRGNACAAGGNGGRTPRVLRALLGVDGLLPRSEEYSKESKHSYTNIHLYDKARHLWIMYKWTTHCVYPAKKKW